MHPLLAVPVLLLTSLASPRRVQGAPDMPSADRNPVGLVVDARGRTNQAVKNALRPRQSPVSSLSAQSLLLWRM